MHINFRSLKWVCSFCIVRIRIYSLLLDNMQTEKAVVDRTNADNGMKVGCKGIHLVLPRFVLILRSIEAKIIV